MMRAPDSIPTEVSTDRAGMSCGMLLARIGSGAMQLFGESLRGIGLKPPAVATLMALKSQTVGQQSLGEMTGVDAVRLVGILNDLEAAGLVERRRDSVDRRRHLVAITAAGRDRLELVERASAVVEERILRGLDGSKREQLASLLLAIVTTGELATPCPESIETGCGDG